MSTSWRLGATNAFEKAAVTETDCRSMRRLVMSRAYDTCAASFDGKAHITCKSNRKYGDLSSKDNAGTGKPDKQF